MAEPSIQSSHSSVFLRTMISFQDLSLSSHSTTKFNAGMFFLRHKISFQKVGMTQPAKFFNKNYDAIFPLFPIFLSHLNIQSLKIIIDHYCYLGYFALLNITYFDYQKLSTQMRDQMNRLKVCDLIFFILFASFMS